MCYNANYSAENPKPSKSPALKIIAITLALAALISLFLHRCSLRYDSGISESYDNTLNTSILKNPHTKNSADLAEWVQMASDKGWGYVYGTFGYVLSETTLDYKSSQYPSEVGSSKDFIRKNCIGRRTVDCMGLIKSYMWYDPDSRSINYAYAAQTMPDIGCDKLFEQAAVKGDIKDIPEIPGLAVWTQGHIGIYIGHGWAIEAKSTREGVKKTRVSKRNWTHWFKIPYVTYQ